MKTLDLEAISKTIAYLQDIDDRLYIYDGELKALDYDARIEAYNKFDKAFRTADESLLALLKKLNDDVRVFELVNTDRFLIPENVWHYRVVVSDIIQAVNHCKVKDGAYLIDHVLGDFRKDVNNACDVVCIRLPTFEPIGNCAGILEIRELNKILKEMKEISRKLECLLLVVGDLAYNISRYREIAGTWYASPEV